MRPAVAGALLLAALADARVAPRRFACEAGRCTPTKTGGTGLEECLVGCQGALWPLPSGEAAVGQEFVPMAPTPAFHYAAVPQGARGLLMKMVGHFKAGTFTRAHKSGAYAGEHTVAFAVRSSDTALSFGVDESYTLQVEGQRIEIAAETVFGARHALETLSQLVVSDGPRGAATYRIPRAVNVTDKPAFAYRGLMVDTGRTYFDVALLKEVVRGMAMTKLNHLHLHLTDTAAFPLALESHPELAEYGASSADAVYTMGDLRALGEYAREHGVSVVPEIDQPGHAAAGWDDEGDEPLVVCTTGAWSTEAVEPPTGQFDPTNPAVHAVLRDIYGELVEALGSDVFHLGGDEVNVEGCWNSSVHARPMVERLDAQGVDRTDRQTFFDLWGNFTQTSLASLKATYAAQGKPLRKVMNWGGQDAGWNLLVNLGPEGRAKVFPKELFMFQLWDPKKGSIAQTLMDEGYDVVLSHYDQFYLDCGTDNWVLEGPAWCAYNSWRHIYDSITVEDAHAHLQGASAAVWTEKIGPSTLLQKIFPRAAALGERLWTHQNATSRDADPRLQAHNDRMIRRGIASEQTQPAWCLQHGAYSCTL